MSLAESYNVRQFRSLSFNRFESKTSHDVTPEDPQIISESLFQTLHSPIDSNLAISETFLSSQTDFQVGMVKKSFGVINRLHIHLMVC